MICVEDLHFFYDKENDQEDRYIQLLINVDSEKKLVSNYFSIISVSVFLGIILSTIASYVLSQKTLKPLKDNMIRQMEFVQNVSHELRTPVTVLRSYIDTLYNYGDEFDTDTKKEFISTLNTEIIRLNSMVNDILNTSDKCYEEYVLKKIKDSE